MKHLYFILVIRVEVLCSWNKSINNFVHNISCRFQFERLVAVTFFMHEKAPLMYELRRKSYVNLTLSRPHIQDDVIKWKPIPRYWPFVRGIDRSPVNSPHKGLWRGALMFSLTCTRINGWVNNCEAGELRCHRGHYDVIVMRRTLLPRCMRACVNKTSQIGRNADLIHMCVAPCSMGQITNRLKRK